MDHFQSGCRGWHHSGVTIGFTVSDVLSGAVYAELSSMCAELLSWIVTTNRGHLRKLKPHECIKGVDGFQTNQHQFVMLCGNPRREKLFREAKLSCEEQKGEGNGAVAIGAGWSAGRSHLSAAGSIMAFHGSPCCVWNSIVKDGLEYKWMRNAQVLLQCATGY